MIAVYGFYYDGNCIYIGSSKDVKHRYIKHKSNCYNKNCDKYYYPFYKYIRENTTFDNLTFMIYQECDKNELLNFERKYIELLKPNCNK